MYKIEPLLPSDAFSLDVINLDYSTESFPLSYYLYYIINHTEDCMAVVSPVERKRSFYCLRDVYGILMGRLEEKDNVICAHISVLSVQFRKRRNGFARLCMDILENNANIYKAYFMDLYVRCTNACAIDFYKKLGYTVYRRVLDYYHDTNGYEDALDMRKSLKLDPENKFMQKGSDIHASKLN
ncbi:putative acetyltransferase [Ordospora colligata]|uniref:Putative acetyltransferase n=1 Tax=Ordospora colligata OC4 TaxID=1354746 RepID=A0A0B2UEB3_9MICR|nr:putative acetyltransferase [Ordospora colligata OC4]KHN69426.1 putative acetyltransferase [Ordospora colligata OC4]TBU14940.1 putative acetyltransferase [Ordospora colligata]TBU15071.1 putative acetyltransferase [Ordospora colligata]TBU18325.1 putative acetyltransferase [Ordospora colligata]